MKKIIFLTMILLPNFLYAKTFDSFISDLVSNAGNKIIGLGVAVGAVFFSYNVFALIMDNGDRRQQFMKRIVFSLILLFVMISFWGIITLMKNTFTDFNASESEFNFEQRYLSS